MSAENSYHNVGTSDSVAPSIPTITPHTNTASPTPAQSAPATSKSVLEAELIEIGGCLAAQLRQCRANSLGWLLQAGAYLQDIRRELEPGEWTRLFVLVHLPFCLRTAQTLVRIAENAALIDAKNLTHLPTSISALDELASLYPALIEQGIGEGTIRPEMTATTAEAFVRQHKQQAHQQHQ